MTTRLLRPKSLTFLHRRPCVSFPLNVYEPFYTHSKLSVPLSPRWILTEFPLHTRCKICSLRRPKNILRLIGVFPFTRTSSATSGSLEKLWGSPSRPWCVFSPHSFPFLSVFQAQNNDIGSVRLGQPASVAPLARIRKAYTRAKNWIAGRFRR